MTCHEKRDLRLQCKILQGDGLKERLKTKKPETTTIDAVAMFMFLSKEQKILKYIV